MLSNGIVHLSRACLRGSRAVTQKACASGLCFGKLSFAQQSHKSTRLDLSDDEKAIRDVALKFAKEEIIPKAEHYDKTGEVLLKT